MLRGLLDRRRAAVELEPAHGYALWAGSYPASAENGLMEVEEREVRRLLPDPAGRACLDLACGSGRYLAHLAEAGAAPCIGLDLVAGMLARARGASPLLVRADLQALPLAPASFEVAVCGLAVGHVRDLGAAIAEMARVLRPGGTLVYSDMHPSGALAGWKRTFEAPDGRSRSIRHFMHALVDHQAACRDAGLVLETVSEPLVEVEGRWQGTPAAVVVRARRP